MQSEKLNTKGWTIQAAAPSYAVAGFCRATDEDLKAIFSFLKSTPPVNNVFPAPLAPNALASK
ncbi:MAG: hypothetical protein M3040_18190 [Bacteroidota bacterium]|nr:hypothetical protein [Bacteroidota bacterium]